MVEPDYTFSCSYSHHKNVKIYVEMPFSPIPRKPFFQTKMFSNRTVFVIFVIFVVPFNNFECMKWKWKLQYLFFFFGGRPLNFFFFVFVYLFVCNVISVHSVKWKQSKSLRKYSFYFVLFKCAFMWAYFCTLNFNFHALLKYKRTVKTTQSPSKTNWNRANQDGQIQKKREKTRKIIKTKNKTKTENYVHLNMISSLFELEPGWSSNRKQYLYWMYVCVLSIGRCWMVYKMPCLFLTPPPSLYATHSLSLQFVYIFLFVCLYSVGFYSK